MKEIEKLIEDKVFASVGISPDRQGQFMPWEQLNPKYMRKFVPLGKEEFIKQVREQLLYAFPEIVPGTYKPVQDHIELGIAVRHYKMLINNNLI